MLIRKFFLITLILISQERIESVNLLPRIHANQISLISQERIERQIGYRLFHGGYGLISQERIERFGLFHSWFSTVMSSDLAREN